MDLKENFKILNFKYYLELNKPYGSFPKKASFLSCTTEHSIHHFGKSHITQDMNSDFGFLHLFQPSAELQPHVHPTAASCSEGKKNTGT